MLDSTILGNRFEFARAFEQISRCSREEFDRIGEGSPRWIIVMRK